VSKSPLSRLRRIRDEAVSAQVLLLALRIERDICIKRAAEEKFSQRQIAQAAGISQSLVRDILRRE